MRGRARSSPRRCPSTTSELAPNKSSTTAEAAMSRASRWRDCGRSWRRLDDPLLAQFLDSFRVEADRGIDLFVVLAEAGWLAPAPLVSHDDRRPDLEPCRLA